MNKMKEYFIAEKELSTWFYYETKKLLADLPKRTKSKKDAQKIDRTQIYQDLRTLNQDLHSFIETHQQFGELYSTNKINDLIKKDANIYLNISNSLGYGLRVDFNQYNFNQYNINIFFFSGKYFISETNIVFNVIYSYLDLLKATSEKFNSLSEFKKEAENEQIKQKRIEKLQDNSIEEWISYLLKDSNYPYQIKKNSDNKMFLLVKMNGTQHLKIPVYYKSFQKIVPQILEAIQQYESVVKNSKIRVLVDNNAPNQQWINN